MSSDAWGLRTPDASEVLSKLRSDPAWKQVKKYDVINTNAGLTTPAAITSKDGIFIWDGAKLLYLTDAEDQSSVVGVNPPSIEAIIHVPIGYYDDELPPNSSVSWFDMKRVLPSKASMSTAERDRLIRDATNAVLMPAVSNEQGGLFLVYSFLYKNQIYRTVAYVSANGDPQNIAETMLDYMDQKTQYVSRKTFMRAIDELAASNKENGNADPVNFSNLSDVLKSRFMTFDNDRTLFLPLTWRHMMDKNVDEKDVKAWDFMKDEDSKESRSRSSSPIGLQRTLNDRLLDAVGKFGRLGF